MYKLILLFFISCAVQLQFPCNGDAEEQQLPKDLRNVIAEVLKQHPEIILDVLERNALDALSIMEQAALKKEASSHREQQLIELGRPLHPAIDLSRPVRGNVQAPVTIIEYGDFYCQYCAASAKVLQTVLTKYKDKVRFLYKHNTLSQASGLVALNFEAIAKQDVEKAWRFHDMVFEKQEFLKNGKTTLQDFEKAISVDVNRLREDLEAARVHIAQDKQEAEEFGFRGTPVFLVNGVAIHGAASETEFFKTIELVLTDKGGK